MSKGPPGTSGQIHQMKSGYHRVISGDVLHKLDDQPEPCGRSKRIYQLSQDTSAIIDSMNV